MKKRKLLIIFVVLLALSLMVAVSACGKKADEGTQGQTTDNEKPQPTKVLKVGIVQALSGPGSLWGQAINKDTDVYAELINEDGGLKIGDDYYKIEMYYADDEDGSADKDVSAARDLIDNKGVQAIVGYWGSALPSIANVMTPTKTILIGTKPVGYDPKIMPYAAFSHTDNEIAIPQVTSALKWFKDTKTLGISVVDLGLSSLQPAIDRLPKELLDAKGVKLVVESYPVTTTDFTQVVEKLKNQNVDTIYSWSFPAAEAMMEKAIYEMGLKPKMNFVGSGTMVDPKDYVKVAGYEAAQGSLHGYQAPWELKDVKVAPQMLEMANRIKQRHQEKYGEELLYAGAFDYGAGGMAMYFEALQKAGTTDPDAVMKAIEGGTFDLFIGTYTMSGAKTYGRAVMSGTTGGLGVVEGEKPRLAVETPLVTIP
ncbi:MAG: ABC transporter substrate-binding protein [Bacillota bacterium]